MANAGNNHQLLGPFGGYDDTSVNGAINSDPYEDDGEPWDCDRDLPFEADVEEDEE